ncbi:MAG: tRNA (adenosine(37)-N6)-dimethylallyltransferase MiaA [Patescibacteria group bacterium]
MTNSKELRLIVIVGPTASGKSDLSIKLAKKYNGEIISADSRQVYRDMDIGTGKVTRDKSRDIKTRNLNLKTAEFYSDGIRHHLIDVADPKQIFTVAHFQKLGHRAIQDILKRKKLPIIVGGTGQYIDTLVYNFALPEVPPDYKLRAKLDKQSTEQLFKQLQELDPKRADNIDRHNPRRLIRALEIIESLGKVPPLVSKSYVLSPQSYDVLWLGLNPKNLNKRIVVRLSARFRQGIIAEVKKLRTKGVSWQRLHDFGLEYRWIAEYLQDKISKDEMLLGLGQAIRQYSKRQMTWFKRNKKISWIRSSREAVFLVTRFLES